jgi:hypothetical protein
MQGTSLRSLIESHGAAGFYHKVCELLNEKQVGVDDFSYYELADACGVLPQLRSLRGEGIGEGSPVQLLSLAGLELISVTPESRLNDYFPYRPVTDVLAEIEVAIGNPDREPTHGLYTQVGTRSPLGLGPMRDFKPHHWKRKGCPAPPPESSRPVESGSGRHNRTAARRRVQEFIDAVPEVAVHVEEIG